MKFIRRILVLLCCLSSVLNCVPAIATEVHDGFNLYQQRFGSYYSIHDILKKKLLCDELVERAESTVQTFEWVTTIGETTICLQEAVSDGFQTILHFKISDSEENAIIRPAFLYFDIYDPYYTQLEEYSEIVYFVEYDFLALSNHSISTNYYGTSNNEREMDYIVVLDNEDEPNIETFREQCIFSVIRYDPDTKKATTQKTESMPIEVQIPSSITYYTFSFPEGNNTDLLQPMDFVFVETALNVYYKFDQEDHYFIAEDGQKFIWRLLLNVDDLSSELHGVPWHYVKQICYNATMLNHVYGVPEVLYYNLYSLNAEQETTLQFVLKLEMKDTQYIVTEKIMPQNTHIE